MRSRVSICISAEHAEVPQFVNNPGSGLFIKICDTFKHQHNQLKIYFIYRNFLPSGQADLLCCGAFAVYEYGFMRHVVHIGL